MSKLKISLFMICLALLIPYVSVFASTNTNLDTSNPIYINYLLNQVEDQLEDSLDKQYNVDWDFDITYNNGTIRVVIEYDTEDSNAFKQITREQLSELITTISKQIIASLGRDMPIEGTIIEDDSNTPNYTFVYNNGTLDIK